MPRLVSFLAAEGVAIDQLTSRITLFNTIDYVLLPALPARIVRISALTLYELGTAEESFLERVQFVSPRGSVVASSETAIALPMRVAGQLPNSHRSIHVMWATPIEEEGDYQLTLAHRPDDGDLWQDRASICITALVQAHPILNAQAPALSVPAIPPAPSVPALPED
jgi:hypothetical protein